MVCLPVTQLGSSPDRALEVEQVVEEHRLALAYSPHTLAQEEPIATEAPAIGDDHAFGAPFGDRDLGGDGVGLVQDARSAAVGHAGQWSRVGEDIASAVRFGRGVFQRVSDELSSGSTSCLAASA